MRVFSSDARARIALYRLQPHLLLEVVRNDEPGVVTLRLTPLQALRLALHLRDAAGDVLGVGRRVGRTREGLAAIGAALGLDFTDHTEDP